MLSHMSNDKKRAPGGCLGYLGDDKLPSYIWIMINHCKDHYETTSIIWKVTVFFFFVAQMCLEEPTKNMGIVHRTKTMVGCFTHLGDFIFR